jgi:hypothetical protein
LTVSSFWRLQLYVNVYSLTRLRIAAAIWMGLVALGLIFIFWRIWDGRSNLWLLRANILSVMVVLYLCCFINFDGIIADFNVRHCREFREDGDPRAAVLDLDYLSRLGPDALPAFYGIAWDEMGAASANFGAEFQDRVEQTRIRIEKKLADGLTDWRSWTFRRRRLSRLQTDANPTTS